MLNIFLLPVGENCANEAPVAIVSLLLLIVQAVPKAGLELGVKTQEYAPKLNCEGKFNSKVISSKKLTVFN